MEQAKRQDEMLYQMRTKLQNRTKDIDKLEEALSCLEIATADCKRLAAENKKMKCLLQRRLRTVV